MSDKSDDSGTTAAKYPHWLYHPTKAPEGQLFQTAADDPDPMTGWVESPADFPEQPIAGDGGVRPSHPIAGAPDRPEVTPPIAERPQPKRRE